VELGYQKFMRKCKKTQLHDYTFKVIDALKKWKVVPIAVEFAIVDYVLRYATSIDMIAVRKGTRSGDGGGSGKVASRRDDTIILIEVKTGYGAGRFEAGQHSMRLPPKVLSAMFPDMMNDAPVNQAILQVLMAKLTLKHRYNVINTEAWVVHVEDEGVSRYTINRSLLLQEDEIYKFADAVFNAPKTAKKRTRDDVEDKGNEASVPYEPSPRKRPFASTSAVAVATVNAQRIGFAAPSHASSGAAAGKGNGKKAAVKMAKCLPRGFSAYAAAITGEGKLNDFYRADGSLRSIRTTTTTTPTTTTTSSSTTTSRQAADGTKRKRLEEESNNQKQSKRNKAETTVSNSRGRRYVSLNNIK
jgi:hypothetical protein